MNNHKVDLSINSFSVTAFALELFQITETKAFKREETLKEDGEEEEAGGLALSMAAADCSASRLPVISRMIDSKTLPRAPASGGSILGWSSKKATTSETANDTPKPDAIRNWENWSKKADQKKYLLLNVSSSSSR